MKTIVKVAIGTMAVIGVIFTTVMAVCAYRINRDDLLVTVSKKTPDDLAYEPLKVRKFGRHYSEL